MLMDLRDAVQNKIMRGATEDQAATAVKLSQYEQMQGKISERIPVRRMYREIMGRSSEISCQCVDLEHLVRRHRSVEGTPKAIERNNQSAVY